jgi:amidohydrolase
MLKRLSEASQASAKDLLTWRRYLHANPELSFEEHETTEWLANRMSEWSIPYTRPTPTGLVGLIEGNRPGKTIAVRADIDALPICEANTFAFRSQREGVMHACGHDGHTAILLGLARFLKEHRDFPGRIKLLFQAAEERPPERAV